MILLGIDSSGLTASAAVVKDTQLLAEITVNNKKTHSQTLLPMIEQVLTMSDLLAEDLDAVAVAAGPGSFTGLRIGSATAKGIAQALDLPIVPVSTLEGLAYRLTCSRFLVCPVLDARRGQVYTAIYRMRGERRPECLLEPCTLDAAELTQKINAFGEQIVFLGDGVPCSLSLFQQYLIVPFQTAPLHLNRQSAASVAALGGILFQEKKTQSAAQHQPEYLRLSQAERERKERENRDRKKGERVP